MLGKYMIPSDASKAGKMTEATPGKGENGLQKAFEKQVKAFIADFQKEYTDVTVIFGDNGYLTQGMVEHYAVNLGRPKYKEYIKYFGWGIAWEFTLANVNIDNKTRQQGFGSMIREAGNYNLKVKYDDDGKFTFIMPQYIEEVDSKTILEYGGDVDDENVLEEEATTSGSTSSGGSLASTAWFFASSFGDVLNEGMSQILTGERAIANDEPVWNAIKDIFNSSMRSIMAIGDGSLVAWYPDYWGVSGNTPCLLLDDIELIDYDISISDDTFYTHQFSAGVDVSGNKLGSQSGEEWALTTGVVSIESQLAAQAANYMNNGSVSDEVSPLLAKLINIPDEEKWRFTPKELYRRYGARPNQTSLSNIIDSPRDIASDEISLEPEYILPFLYTLYEFMKNWAHQWTMNLELCYMPQIERGMRIKLKTDGISGYVESVKHSGGAGSLSGYKTSVTLICPQCEKGDPRFPGMVSWEK